MYILWGVDMSRKQRKAKRKARLIHDIFIDIDYTRLRPDVLWITFNRPDPHPRRHNEVKLTIMFNAETGKGEVYVSKHFPGITYKKSKLPSLQSIPKQLVKGLFKEGECGYVEYHS
jgi:hypothetical protein